MTDKEINERVAAIAGFHNTVGLMKRGLWYRAKACGYTNCECDAGRFTLEEAKRHEYLIGDEPITIHKFKTPNYSESLDACREFMQSLNSKERDDFVEIAWKLGRVDKLYNYEFWWAFITLTPLELCECFLKLKGQWE